MHYTIYYTHIYDITSAQLQCLLTCDAMRLNEAPDGNAHGNWNGFRFSDLVRL